MQNNAKTEKSVENESGNQNTTSVQTVVDGSNSKPLTKDEQKAYDKCEVIIKKGAAAFIEVGEALIVVRDGCLYRNEFNTFKEYCTKKWQMSVKHAYRLMDANEVVKNLECHQLETNESIPIPHTESCARQLAKLSPKKQVEAVRLASKESPNPTAKVMANAAKQVSAGEPKVVSGIVKNEFDSFPADKVDRTKEEMAKLMDLVDRAQTYAKRVNDCGDVVKILGDVAKLITRKLNGDAKC